VCGRGSSVSGKVKWLAFANTIMNLQVPRNAEVFLTVRTTIPYARRTAPCINLTVAAECVPKCKLRVYMLSMVMKG
jgi:hypothetical protein